jgi:hypothetical protein
MPDDGVFQNAYEAMQASADMDRYKAGHGIQAAPVLTITDDATAHAVTEALYHRIAGKTVVEIGGGIGPLALHLGTVARRVWCIEANPVWASSFIAVLMQAKPANVSYLFGAADEFAGTIRADIALFCSHSGIASMTATAARFAPVVIDVYGEVIAARPEQFDALAVTLRQQS